MRSVVFADIDGTLIEPVSRAPTGASVAVAATDRLGRPVCFRTPQNEQLLKILSAADVLIPVTGRSLPAFRRVDIRFNSFAILHHGAMIIDGRGEECIGYGDEISADIQRSHEVIDEAFGHAEREIITRGLPLRIYRQTIKGNTVEVCVKHVNYAADKLSTEADAIAAYWHTLPTVRVHRNGNNLALLSDMVTKARAVRWLADRLVEQFGAMTTFGIGDSTSDLGFMTACDYWIVPRHSQIGQRTASVISER